MIEYKVERKIKGTRVLFYATVNDRRINNINYARKYDARGLIRSFKEKYSETEIIDKLNKVAA